MKFLLRKLAVISVIATAITLCRAQDILFEFGNEQVSTLKSVDGRAECRSAAPMKVSKGAFMANLGPVPEIYLPDGFPSGNTFTVSLWIKLNKEMTSIGNYNILFKGSRVGFPQLSFAMSMRSDRPEFKYINDNGNWRGIMMNAVYWVGINRKEKREDLPKIEGEKWVMLTSVFDNGKISIYIDGNEFFSTSGNQPLPRNSFPVLLGAGHSLSGTLAWPFPGLMAKVRFSENAMSKNEIQELYQREFKELDHDLRHPGTPYKEPVLAEKLGIVREYEKNLPEMLPVKPNITVEIKNDKGVNRIFIDGKAINGMCMVPSPYTPASATFRPCRDFAAAGIKVYSTIIWTQGRNSDWWIAEGKYDFSKIDDIMANILNACPDGYIFPRVKMDPPKWWIEKNQEEMGDGSRPSVASRKWRDMYEKMLRDLVPYIEKNWGGRVIGYMPVAMTGGEWIQYNYKFTPMRRAFREWVAKKYNNDLALMRNAYGNNNITFENVDEADSPKVNKLHIVLPLEQTNLIRDWHECLAEYTANAILHSCGIIKELTGRKKLTGVFFGYGSPEHGHIHRVLSSPDVDFFSSPTNYMLRNAGDPGVYTTPYTASFNLHGKLYYDEADIRTHFYKLPIEYRAKNMNETLSVIKRAIGYSITQGTDAWWFLLVGNSLFHDEKIMETIAHGKAAADKNIGKADMLPKREVAVFVCEHSKGFFSGNLSMNNASQIQSILSRTGVPYDMYLIEDIAHKSMPDYKVYVFLNAFNVDSSLRKAIAAKIKRNGSTAIWIGAPGYMQDNVSSVDLMEKLIGIKLKEHVLQNAGIDYMSINAFGGGESYKELPSKFTQVFEIVDKDTETLGTYQQRPSVGWKKMNGWNSVYTLTMPDVELYRRLFARAGVHNYIVSDDIVSVGNNHLMLHAASTGRKKIALPVPCRITDIYSGWQSKGKVSSFNIDIEFGDTVIYNLKP
ncbi:MAG: LamG domain-containing protein [Victivallales bacterium]|nr:LamG domain-containing protein [Victivallales bacterium]